MPASSDTRPWEGPFISALAEFKVVKAAAEAAGVPEGTVQSFRRRSARFAAKWGAALKADAAVLREKQEEPREEPEQPAPEAVPFRRWRGPFFEALAETSNVTASAARAGVPLATVYKFRREDRDFATRWQAALAEGYDNLEMELVGHLRDPEPKRKMDVAAALRLLSAHRDTVERRRALTSEEDEKATVESLNAFFEGLKQRRLANQKALREADNDDAER